MFTSAIDNKKSRAKKAALTYLGITLFCILLSTVYEHFSHGVYSNYMIFLFAFPLFGGTIPFTAIGLFKHLWYPTRLSLNIYNSGIATLAVGSLFKGALEIYGTSSALVPFYWIIGSVMAAVGLVLYFINSYHNSPEGQVKEA